LETANAFLRPSSPVDCWKNLMPARQAHRGAVKELALQAAPLRFQNKGFNALLLDNDVALQHAVKILE